MTQTVIPTIPTHAVILAAGLGTRLQPMTLATPKPLMPIWNRPMLAHLLAMLEGWGIRSATINAHHLHEQIDAWVAAYKGPIALSISYEPQILGTGGALRPIQETLTEPFWLINGDIALDLRPEPLVEAFAASGRFAATWLEPKKGPRTVEMDYAGRITNYASPSPGVPHTYTMCGVHLLSPEIVRYLPEGKPFCSIVDAYYAAMNDNRFVRGVIQPASYWNDGGTLARYLEIHAETRRLQNHYYAEHDQIPEKYLQWICGELKWDATDTVMIPLGRRGSNRTFWRLVNGKQAVMAISYATDRPDNARYADATQLLTAAGVPVAKLLVNAPRRHVLAIEDLGDDVLEKRKDDFQLDAIMQALAKFHAVKPTGCKLEPPFTAELYHWEQNLFATYWGAFSEEAQRECEVLIQKLTKAPRVLVHRDFQSSNIIFHKGKPYFIDFQGMRKGPAAYDVASFLYDPYIMWSDEQQAHALAAYVAASGDTKLPELLPYAGIQRLLQALGAFKRLESVGQKRFAAYIPRAQKTLQALCRQVGFTALGSF